VTIVNKEISQYEEQPSRSVPLHKQVETELRNWIEIGKYDSGDQIPTAKEISKLCSVNEQTVRRAIKVLIHEGVLEGAQGKGVFVSRCGAKHKRVALVLPNLEDELTIQIARGARRVLDENGFQLVILDAQRDSEKEKANITGLQDLPTDGAIVFPVAYSDISERLLRLKMDHFALVLVDKHFPGVDLDCVLADDYGGSYALASALLDRGYKRLAWIGGEEGSSTVENRLDGYRWALGDRGIAVPREMVSRLKLSTPTSPYQESLAKEIERLLALKQRPDAILCVNDLIAIDVAHILEGKGLKVPADVAVAGFDDLKVARESRPAMTTVRKSIEEMGAKAAELLLQRIVKKNAPMQRIVVPAEVVIRESA
jgi:GntR family transcriptional regulator, arabinose operon transcriptional repressor